MQASGSCDLQVHWFNSTGTKGMEQRIQAVELKLMDIELTVEQLNDVIVRHENTIQQLNKKLELYQSQLQALASPMAKESEETPPPHY